MRSRSVILLAKASFCVLTVLEAILVIVLGLVRLFKSQELSGIPHLFVLATNASFVTYFAVDSVLAENPWTIFSFIFASLSLLINVVLTFVYPSSSAGRDWVIISRFTIVLVVTPIQIMMIVLIWRCFGWKRTMTVGLDPKLVGLYKWFQAFLTTLHQDLYFSVLLLIIIAFCLIGSDYYRNWEFYLCWLLITWVVGVDLWAQRSVKRESTPSLIVTAVASCGPALYLIARGLSIAIMHPPKLHPVLEDNMFILAFIVGIFALVNRGLLIFTTYRCYMNFGQGLRDRGMTYVSIEDSQDPVDSQKFKCNSKS